MGSEKQSLSLEIDKETMDTLDSLIAIMQIEGDLDRSVTRSTVIRKLVRLANENPRIQSGEIQPEDVETPDVELDSEELLERYKEHGTLTTD